MPKLMTPLPLPTLSVLLSISSLLAATSLASDPLYTSCSSTDNFTSPSPYASNLRILLSALITATPKATNFFSLNTSGAADSPQAFGLAQCRPDASAATCSACLTNAAATSFNDSCPGQKSASVRNDYCVLRYADHPFASAPDDSNFKSLSDPENATDPATFSQDLEDLLTGLMQEAVGSPLRIAAGMTAVGTGVEQMKVFGLAWCTADLSSDNCYQCLDQALKSYMGCCGDKIGGGTFTVSCIITYNNFPFFNVSLIQDSSASPQSGTGTRRLGQNLKIILPVSILAAVLSALTAVYIFIICRRRRRLVLSKASGLGVEGNIMSMESHLFHLASLKSATNNFSDENKLHEGKFGPVYMGVLSDGQLVVVKRLSRTSGQGLEELKNEAALVAQLQHKNLVKLLGCCMQEDEKLLIYEYLSNGSLDKHLYDPARRAQLDWGTRHLIIEGIARGLVYLHNHSRLKIIHRDLNAGNILLDGSMNPKISEFGIAKLVGINETQWDTKQVAGTYGYMAPEYAMRGVYSTKSDVFSYGMVVLEIITGRRNGSFMDVGNAFNLQSYVWQSWSQGKGEEVIDLGLDGQYQVDEVLRCINIGLLCIQVDPVERPSMASVVLMLSSNAETLPAPSQPAYFTVENPTCLSTESSTTYDLHSIEHLTGSSTYSMNGVSMDIMQAR